MSRVPAPAAARVASTLSSCRGRAFAVIGAGRSGLAAAGLLASRGARVRVLDDRDVLDPLPKELQGLSIELCAGGFTVENLQDSAAIVVSPGVPLTHPVLMRAHEQGALLIGEIDVALTSLSLPVVAVTGTNGKSTTTTMIGALLRSAGWRPFVGGNLGAPLSGAARRIHDFDVLVVELSSYQLELCSLLRPRVALITNLAPDHLDRYPSVENYYDAKRRIYRTVSDNGICVVRHNEIASGLLNTRTLPATRVYGDAPSASLAARVLADRIVLDEDGRARELRIDNPRIRGAHNRENLAAALLAAQALGLSAEVLQTGIAAYEGVPHRLQDVARVDGVLYVNDSKGTNVDATVCALRAFDEPIVLIAGGRGKATGYEALAEAARDRVRVLLSIGEDGPAISEALKACVEQRVAAGDLKQALRRAHELARPGEVVLLSPACASFDQFANYEVRGRVFVEGVQHLAGEGA